LTLEHTSEAIQRYKDKHSIVGYGDEDGDEAAVFGFGDGAVAGGSIKGDSVGVRGRGRGRVGDEERTATAGGRVGAGREVAERIEHLSLETAAASSRSGHT
jgi:hypothetical protein